MAAAVVWYSNPMIWAIAFFITFLFVIIQFIFLILLKMFTHGFVELKAKMKGIPIAMFFEDSRYMNWKPIKPEAGLVQDKEYGTFLINEQGSYVDRKTKNVYLPFDAQFAAGSSIKTFKMSDDLWKVFQDERKLNEVRKALLAGKLDNAELEGLRESVNFSHLRSLSNTILPHNITSKIEKTIAGRMAGFGKVNGMQAALMFVSILGAIVMAAILLKMFM
jgi:hypothetical protein